MWFYFALLSAVLAAVATICRRIQGATARPIELAWWTQLLSIPFAPLFILASHQPLYSGHGFLLPGLASAALGAYANILAFNAYKHGDVSAITPLNNLQPIGLLLVAMLMFRTVIPTAGLIGILLIVTGVYYISVSDRYSLLQPIKSLWTDRGSRAMLGAILLWSVSINLDKIALRSASSSFYLLYSQIVTCGFISLYLMAQPKKQLRAVWHRWWKQMFAIAGFMTGAVFFQFKAVALTNSGYVFAVRRLDTLIVILFAGWVLREKHIMRRFQGAAVAVAGVVILYLVK